MIPHCLLCNKSYKRDDKYSIIPYLLSCAHSICNFCLQKISQPNSIYISCPICSEKTQLKAAGEWKSLHKDIYAHGLILISKSMPSKDLIDSLQNFAYKKAVIAPKKYICIECGYEATCRCNKCDDLFCGACFDKFHQGNSTKKHQAKPLNADTNFDLDNKLMCQIHTKNKNILFCVECDEAICEACVSSNHAGHKCMSIAEKNKNCLEIIDEFLKLGLVQEAITRENKQDISSLINICSKKGNSLISSLNINFHLLYSAIQLKQFECHELIRKNMINEEEKLEQLNQKLIQISSDLNNFFKDAMNIKRNHEIVPINIDDVKQKFDTIYNMPSKANINMDEFIHGCEIDLASLLNAISSIDLVIKNPPDITLETLIDQQDFVNEKKNKLALNCIEELTDRLGVPRSRLHNIEIPKSYIMNTEIRINDSLGSSKSSVHSLSSSSSLDSKIPVGRIPPSRNFSFKNEILQVKVMYVQNPCHFSVHLVKDSQIIQQLFDNIQKYCYLNYKINKTITDIPEGGWILACYKDNNWYRAKMINVKPVEKMAEIYYLDYGNTDKVPFSKLMKIPNHLTVHQPLAHLCSLVDIVPANRESMWKLEASEIFHRIVSTKIMTMHVLEIKNEFFFVDLAAPIAENIENDGPASLRDIFVFLGLACFDTEHSRPLEFSQRQFGSYIEAKLPEVDTNVNIIITHVENPDKFFVQINSDEIQQYYNLSMEMQAIYESSTSDQYDLLCPSIGNVCVAKYSLDSKWYRAIVLEFCTEGNVKVKYVDFGNEEIVSVFRIKKIIDRHRCLPMLAIECKCADSRPCDATEIASWENKANEILTEMIDKVDVFMRIIDVDETSRVLTIYVNDSNSMNVENNNSNSVKPPSSISAQLQIMTPKSLVLEKSVSMKTSDASSKMNGKFNSDPRNIIKVSYIAPPINGPPPPGIPIKICNFISPGCFFVHLQETNILAMELSQSITKYMKQKKHIEVNKTWVVGDMCLALDSIDGNWKRAMHIDSSGEDFAKVFFIDFGIFANVPIQNIDIIENVAWKELTQLAVRCHLSGCVPAGTVGKWSQTSCEFLYKHLSSNTSMSLFLMKQEVEEICPDSSAVEIFYYEKRHGGPLEPDYSSFISFSDFLINNGLAFKRKTGKPPVIDLSMNNQNFYATVSMPSQSPILNLIDHSLNNNIGYPPFVVPEEFEEMVFLKFTHINKKGVIFGHLFKKEVKDTLIEINELASLKTINEDHLWREGDLCSCFCKSENVFIRAQIVKLIPMQTMVEINYVDYGDDSNEVVSFECLRSPVLLTTPILCFGVQLLNIKWNLENGNLSHSKINEFNTIMEEMESVYIARLKRVDITPNLAYVYFKNNQNLNDILVDRGLAKIVSEDDNDENKDDNDYNSIKTNINYYKNLFSMYLSSVEESELDNQIHTCNINKDNLVIPKREIDLLPPSESFISLKREVPSPYKILQLANINEFVNCTITGVCLPNIVYLQRNFDETNKDVFTLGWNSFIAKLIKYTNIYKFEHQTMKPVEPQHLKRGFACLAQHPYNEIWYRAEIISVLRKQSVYKYRVLFIDHGTIEIIDNSARFRQIPPDHLEMPAMSYPCKLCGLEEETIFPQYYDLFYGIQVKAAIKEFKFSSPIVILYNGSEKSTDERPFYLKAIIDNNDVTNSDNISSSNQIATDVLPIKIEIDSNIVGADCIGHENVEICEELTRKLGNHIQLKDNLIDLGCTFSTSIKPDSLMGLDLWKKSPHNDATSSSNILQKDSRLEELKLDHDENKFDGRVTITTGANLNYIEGHSSINEFKSLSLNSNVNLGIKENKRFFNSSVMSVVDLDQNKNEDSCPENFD